MDTHVWALACKYYLPHLRGKSLTKKVCIEWRAGCRIAAHVPCASAPSDEMLLCRPVVQVHGEVQAAFVKRFGPYCGWAHNTLFIAELASTRDKIPAIGSGSKRAAPASGSDSEDEGDGEEEGKVGGSSETSGGSAVVEKESGVLAAGLLPVTPPGGDAQPAGTAPHEAASKRPRRRATKKTTGGA